MQIKHHGKYFFLSVNGACSVTTLCTCVGHVSIVQFVSSGIHYLSYLLCQLEHFNTRLTPRVPLVEQELRTLPEHLRSPMVFSGVRVTRSYVLQTVFFCPFVLFLLGIALFVLLRCTEFDCPEGVLDPIYRRSPSSFLVCHKLDLDVQRQASRLFMLNDLQ